MAEPDTAPVSCVVVIRRRHRTETERRAVLPDWLHTYNNHRGHTAIDGHPHASRVPNLSGQNT